MLQGNESVEQKDSPILSLQLSFTLSNFQQTIRHNFETIQTLLQQQQKTINRLQLVSSHEKKIQPAQNQQSKEEVLLNPESNKKSTTKLTQENHQNQVSVEPIIKIQKQNAPIENVGKTQKEQAIQMNQAGCRKQSQVQIQVDLSHLEKPPTLIPIEIQVQETQYLRPSAISNVEQTTNDSRIDGQMLESKIFQLFQRVRQLEQKELHHSHMANKNIKQYEYAIEQNTRALEKQIKVGKNNEQEIQKLRNELSQYKLKKEAKLNKLIHSSTGNSNNNVSSNNDTYDYIAEKIQLLLKAVKQSLTKKQFQEERQVLQTGIDVIRKKINQKVSENYLQQSLKNIQAKIYNTVIKFVKAQNIKKKKVENHDQQVENEQNQLNKIIEENDKQFSQRVNLQSQKIQSIIEQIQFLREQLQLSRKQRMKDHEYINQNIRDLIESDHRLDQRIKDHQRNLQQFKDRINKKELDSQHQIIQIQEQLQKIGSQIKKYSYSQPESRSTILPRSKQIVQGDQNREEHNSQLTSFMEQDIAILKKKVGKLTLKQQSLKEDLASIRQEILRDIDGLKMNNEKKADWDSLKKGLTYFEQKLKEVKVVIEHLYNSQNQVQEDNSLAVKKGWTCLMCDRNIQHYEGKLSELKFTSQFPVRESPRIGGYYKQQQMSQQYKQVFLNHRSKRNSSLKSGQSNPSREDINI